MEPAVDTVVPKDAQQSRSSGGFRDATAARYAKPTQLLLAGRSGGVPLGAKDVKVGAAVAATAPTQYCNEVSSSKRGFNLQCKPDRDSTSGSLKRPSVEQMLRSRHVRGVTPAPAVMRERLRVDSCCPVHANVPLVNKSSVSIRRELNKALSEALANGTVTQPFAKACGFDDKPRADDIEGMVKAFLEMTEVDWDAESVASGLNIPLWRFLHAMHCKKCTKYRVDDSCYFRLVFHFLRSGFEPSVMDGKSLQDAVCTVRAYVDLWRAEQRGCDAAFDKWMTKMGDLVSDPTAEVPDKFFPILPVVREKDRWRHLMHGLAYAIRLCMDFKSGKLNALLKEWGFKYWGLECLAERVQQDDWLATLDISSFYLRLPAGKRLRAVQWFQDPSSYGCDNNANDRMSYRRMRFRQLHSIAFGLKPAPAFASIISAELARIFRAFGIKVAGTYIDDFLIRGRTREQTMRSYLLARSIAESLGVPMNDKGQEPRSPAEGVVYLGVHIRTADCSMQMTAEHREYAKERVLVLLRGKFVTVKDLENIGGILSWISHVHVPGRPRRNFIFRQLSSMKKRKISRAPLRGELKQQLHWWYNSLNSSREISSFFWPSQPPTSLIYSDASGEDGWGACVDGLHFAGPWPPEWRQSAGASSPHMLFKELLPPALVAMILAPFKEGEVLASVADNSGTAFSLNKLSCRCSQSLKVLRPLCDSLTANRVSLVADHIYRDFNEHTDALSHAVPYSLWHRFLPQVPNQRKTVIPFAVLDTATGECYTAFVTYARIIFPDVPDVKL